jgi:hypothetical protein
MGGGAPNVIFLTRPTNLHTSTHSGLPASRVSFCFRETGDIFLRSKAYDRVLMIHSIHKNMLGRKASMVVLSFFFTKSFAKYKVEQILASFLKRFFFYSAAA